MALSLFYSCAPFWSLRNRLTSHLPLKQAGFTLMFCSDNRRAGVGKSRRSMDQGSQGNLNRFKAFVAHGDSRCTPGFTSIPLRLRFSDQGILFHRSEIRRQPGLRLEGSRCCLRPLEFADDTSMLMARKNGQGLLARSFFVKSCQAFHNGPPASAAEYLHQCCIAIALVTAPSSPGRQRQERCCSGWSAASAAGAEVTGRPFHR